MSTLTIVGLAGTLVHAALDGWRLPRVRYTRRGGMRFLRIGRIQLSLCICRRALGED